MACFHFVPDMLLVYYYILTSYCDFGPKRCKEMKGVEVYNVSENTDKHDEVSIGSQF